MSDKLTICLIVGANLLLFGFSFFTKWIRVSSPTITDKIIPSDDDEDDDDDLDQNGKRKPVVKGSSFGVVLDFMVIGIFYDLDKKFAVVCPEVDNKYIDFGWIIGVNDKQELDFESKNIEKSAYTKGLSMYKSYKESNPNRFH